MVKYCCLLCEHTLMLHTLKRCSIQECLVLHWQNVVLTKKCTAMHDSILLSLQLSFGYNLIVRMLNLGVKPYLQDQYGIPG